MSEVTRLIDAAAAGDRQASSRLLPLVYDELRRLAEIRLTREPAGHTLQPTALVHEAYLRLIGSDDAGWDGRHHFFGAAAAAMRRVLVDSARTRNCGKRGGGLAREYPDFSTVSALPPDQGVEALHDALTRFAEADPVKAKLVELRFFGGLTLNEAADCLGISLSTAARAWRFARAWLYRAMTGAEPVQEKWIAA
jgi:RNA polymerase sigma factor (TIGR02999 family)